jgi:DNA-binding MarR family transcriptional regulator
MGPEPALMGPEPALPAKGLLLHIVRSKLVSQETTMATTYVCVGASMEPGTVHRRARRRPRRIFQPIIEAQRLCSYWLKRADRRLSSTFARELKWHGIIASEWAALREMYRPGRSCPVALATALGMTKGGASKLLDRLVKKGLARKELSEFDRRYRPAKLTKRGRDLVPYLAMRDDSIDRGFFPKEKLRYNLMRALKRVAHAPRKEWADVWHIPRPKASSVNVDFYFYSPGTPPPPSAVASNASNSSDDSSRNWPLDK